MLCAWASSQRFVEQIGLLVQMSLAGWVDLVPGTVDEGLSWDPIIPSKMEVGDEKLGCFMLTKTRASRPNLLKRQERSSRYSAPRTASYFHTRPVITNNTMRLGGLDEGATPLPSFSNVVYFKNRNLCSA